MKKTKKQASSHMSAGEILGIGAAVAAAAGAYFLYGKGKQAHTQVKSWALKAKADVLDQLEKAHVVSEDTYRAIVNRVATKYEKLQQVDPNELKAMISDIHGHWKNIQKQMQTPPSKSTHAPHKKSPTKKTTK